jgi:predicted AlkP superfamily phosphohydrolase/phosphomutase
MWKYLDPEKDWSLSPGNQYRDLLKDFWRHLDEAIGKLLKVVGKDTTIIVLSDHGFGTQSETFFVNEWLCRQGFLRLIGAENRYVTSGAFLRNARILGHAMLKHLPIPESIRSLAPKSLRQALQNEIPFEAAAGRIEWSQTKAYSPLHTSVYGTIYLNLKGREEQGAVEPHLYDQVREQIIRELISLGDESPNRKIKVFKREDVYRGVYLAQAPDLIYVIDDFRCASRQSFHGGLIFQSDPLGEDYSGTHRLDGVFIARGSDIKQGYWLGQSQIVDVTPTLLHILGIPIPEDMDGKVLKSIFNSDSELAKRDIHLSPANETKFGRETEEPLDSSVRKRLEDLGYL